jgi:hypothetical protein
MRQGAVRHALSARGNDLYETPACAVHALLKVEPLVQNIWEPAAGRGAISRILRDAGHTVVTQDLVAYEGADQGIETPIDFLMEREPPSGFSTIVTNPPFKNADDFVRHGLDLGCMVVVLLRLMAIEGAGRADLIDRHCRRIWAGIERLPTMHREGWEGNRQSNSGAPFAWFVFHPQPRHAETPIELRRISWRTPA